MGTLDVHRGQRHPARVQSEQAHGCAVFSPQSPIFKPVHHAVAVLLDIFASVVQRKGELLLWITTGKKNHSLKLEQ